MEIKLQKNIILMIMVFKLRNFVQSVYFRILEIKYKKEFPKNENLYPGLYIKDIANKIINDNKN